MGVRECSSYLQTSVIRLTNAMRIQHNIDICSFLVPKDDMQPTQTSTTSPDMMPKRVYYSKLHCGKTAGLMVSSPVKYFKYTTGELNT